MTLEEYDKQVRNRLKNIAKSDILADMEADDSHISLHIEWCYNGGFSTYDAAKYIAYTSQELDENFAIASMDELCRKYHKA